MQEYPTRRQLLATTAGASTVLLGGLALTTNRSEATTASVSGSYSVPDAKVVLADQTLEKITLEVNASWEFQSNAEIHAVETELHVGATPDTMDLIARQEKDGLGEKSLTGNPVLSGGLTNASDFTIENFQPSSGELAVSVVSALRFYVLRNGEVVAEDEQLTTFTVTVSEEELEVNASVGGQGEVSFKTSG